MKTVLTIAGSDSIAGAGIQADLKTFAALGTYGVSAVTAVTAQNTTGVADILAIPTDLVRSQIEQITSDTVVAAVKTGMLATAEIVRAVTESLGRLRPANLVVDPVMTATAEGARTLLEPDAVSVLKARLLPIAAVVTPNAEEAKALSGIQVDSLRSAREAAKRIADFGSAAVLVKGGHLDGPQAIDVLLHDGTFSELVAPRSSFGAIHGTGCTLSSAIAVGLALGDDIPAAAQRAKRYVTGTIEHSLDIGRGSRILNHFWDLRQPRTL